MRNDRKSLNAITDSFFLFGFLRYDDIIFLFELLTTQLSLYLFVHPSYLIWSNIAFVVCINCLPKNSFKKAFPSPLLKIGNKVIKSLRRKMRRELRGGRRSRRPERRRRSREKR